MTINILGFIIPGGQRLVHTPTTPTDFDTFPADHIIMVTIKEPQKISYNIKEHPKINVKIDERTSTERI